MHVHEDIQIGVTSRVSGKHNFCNDTANEHRYSEFTNLRDNEILTWIQKIVPDVFVVGNLGFHLQTM